MAAWTPPSTHPAFSVRPNQNRPGALGSSPLAAAPAVGVFLALLLASPALSLPVFGTSSGTFVNPDGGPATVASGDGTSTFRWGDGAPFGSPSSALQFSGKTIFSSTESVFSFGTLSYYNGTTALGSDATGVDLRVSLDLLLPTAHQTFDFGLNLVTTPNTSNPFASADLVEWSSASSESVFHYAGNDYTLEFLGFGAPAGAGFASVDRFYVLEGGSAWAQLLGRITEAPKAVPEPTTLALFSIGLLGAGFAMRKKKIPLH